MQIVLPGALPEPREANELAAHLIKTAPTLAGWMARAHHNAWQASPVDTGCLPHEYWQLRERGFRPAPDQNFATGLAVLRTDASRDPARAIWLAELVHVAPSRDGAALIPAQEIDITPAQSVALFESVHDLFLESGFQLDEQGLTAWQITPPADCLVRAASPALVAITSVNDWWSQDLASRPWRKLVNEVQMLWFDHPVNIERQRQGLPPINSLWLYGGASANQLDNKPLPERHTYDLLFGPAIRHDWSAWLEGLAWLDKTLEPALTSGSIKQLILTSRERIIELAPPSRWAQWLPRNKDTWRKWWSPRN